MRGGREGRAEGEKDFPGSTEALGALKAPSSGEAGLTAPLNSHLSDVNPEGPGRPRPGMETIWP